MDAPIDDLRGALVVPAQPGPLVRLDTVERARDDLDDVLDDVFGTDDRGPGVADAVLVGGGVATVAAAQLASWPSIVTVVGIAAAALGVVLPARAAMHRVASMRRRRAVRALVGEGVVLRVEHPALAELAAEHERLREAAGALTSSARVRVEQVAHSALWEVATLVRGGSPRSAAEVDYVHERVRALASLRATLADPRVGDGEHERRRALVEARREVEAVVGGSSVTEAADLARDLLGGDEP